MKSSYLYSAMCVLALTVGSVGCDSLNSKVEEVQQGKGLLGKGVDKYNTLVDKDEDCNLKWADYQSTLQRRNDMIPQLVGVVKGAAQHEEKTLIAVTEARASATRPQLQLQEARHNADGTVTNDFEDPQKFAAFQAAQATLGTTMQRLLVANEQYPQVAALPAFHDLQVQVEGTENRINTARENFNLSVKEFNTELRHVSGKVINPLTGMEFKQRQYFQADQGANVAPTVDFGK